MSDKDIMHRLDHLENQVRAFRKEVLSLKNERMERISELGGVLRRRGLDPYRQNSKQHLFFPPVFPQEKKDIFYEFFKKYSFRLFLREVLIRKGGFRVSEVVRFSTVETGRKYLHLLIDLGLAEPAGNHRYRLGHASPASLGSTLEWFMAEVFRREFACPALYGLRCRGARYGGDYDVVALLEGWLVYMEVKSSPPKNIEGDEVRAFLFRLKDLWPHVALFFVDTELRLKDKIVPFFETELRAQGQGDPGDSPSVQKIGDEIFFLPPRIYILSSKRSMIKNIGACFRNHFTLALAPYRQEDSTGSCGEER
jgi:hypothetical protein